VLAKAAPEAPRTNHSITVTISHQTRIKATIILAAIAAAEGVWVWFSAHRNPWGFLRYEGFIGYRAGVLGWLLAILVSLGFIALAAHRLPSVRANLFALSWLKVLAVFVAAGLCEETVFRKLIMDSLAQANHGVALQLTASAVLFGAAHGIWGAFRGSVIAAIGATVATGILGLGLGTVFLASHRVLAPCVVSHFLINLSAEPGLVLALLSGEMSRLGATRAN
jgi:membrane protease YdiL (CAAX protease family)